MLVKCPHKTRLGDSIAAVNNACHLSKNGMGEALLVPNNKIFAWGPNQTRRAIDCFRFALSLFDLGPIKSSLEDRHGKPLPKLPESCYLNHAIPIAKENPDLILLDLEPRTGLNKFDDKLKKMIWDRAHELGTPIDLHGEANKNGLQSTVDLFKRAKCFIGADSGFAHASHALDVPCFMFRNKGPIGRMERWHRYNQYTLVNSPADIMISPAPPVRISRDTGSW